MTNDNVHTERRPYSSPVLKVYGDVSTITLRTGVNNRADGGTGLGKTRSANGSCNNC